ncbi:MAG TPA: ATP-binding protein [Verrucomicrobiae bacterium]|nr:ATP-binding protein [Verrucomicrobiae bacterium]
MAIWLLASALSAHSQAVTNLLQLVEVVTDDERPVRDVQLDATVCAASDPSIGVLVLKDSTDAVLVELGAGQPKIVPGDKIWIQHKNCLLRRRDIGVQISTAPLVDNNFVHDKLTSQGGAYLTAGLKPLTLEWFNQSHPPYLKVSFWPLAGTSTELPASALFCSVSNRASSAPQMKPGLNVECFEGDWDRAPDFDLLKPVKSGIVTNFDLDFRSRDEMVGLRFKGFLNVPTNGYYFLTTRSADGSLVYVDDPTVKAVVLGNEPAPPPVPAMIGQAVSNPSGQQWVSVDGRVSSAWRTGRGLDLELRADRNSLLARIADAQGLDAAKLLNSRVRLAGIGYGVFNLSGGLGLGQISVAGVSDLKILDEPRGVVSIANELRKIKQVQSLPIKEAGLGLPVHIRGVVTSIGRRYDFYLTIQDETRGIFAYYRAVSNAIPVCGDYYEIVGRSGTGDFAPIVVGDKLVRLGKGRMPEPAHPAWNALVNGSMDQQWVEFQGLVTDVHSNILSMLVPGGQIDVQITVPVLANLDSFKKSVVTLRGVLFAEWNARREVRVGLIDMHNAGIITDIPAPANPFDADLKTPRDLLLFDAQASAFRRVKVRGQIVYADASQIFLMEGDSGLRIFPAGKTDASSGDLVEVVGYPYIGGAAPVLRDALLRKTGAGQLPAAMNLTDSELTQSGMDSTRVRVTGQLLGWHLEQGLPVLEMQWGAHLYFARLASANAGDLSWRKGSMLALTGVFVAQEKSFEILLNSPEDVVVLSQPSWWTLQRLLVIVGILVIVLILAMVWITQLRRLVELRTSQLGEEIRERELEAERSRIARDLHDDLGSSLTEISVLANTGHRNEAGTSAASETLFQNIASKARYLISALDVIVWAVDPADNSLQSLADYLCAYAEEYLSSTNIACRFKVPVSFPAITLDGRVRHELLMTVKETLHNIVRHAGASEVEFRMAVTGNYLEIALIDNGKGIPSTVEHEGHGLKNLLTRMQQLGGKYSVKSNAGSGTIVIVSLPLDGAAGSNGSRTRQSYTTNDGFPHA